MLFLMGRQIHSVTACKSKTSSGTTHKSQNESGTINNFPIKKEQTANLKHIEC